AAFAVLLTFAFGSAVSAGLFTAMFVGVSVFLSGSIIPTEYFAGGLRLASNVVFNTWAVRLLGAAITGGSLAIPLVVCLVFGVVFAGVGYVAVASRLGIHSSAGCWGGVTSISKTASALYMQPRGFLVTSFLLNFKKFAGKRAVWITLVVLPAVLAISGLFAQADTPVIEITAGVMADSANELEAGIVLALAEIADSTHFINFKIYDNIDSLLQDVRLGRIECGYVLSADIEAVARGELGSMVTLIRSPRTVADPLLNEIVAAAIFRAASLDITEAWLNANFPGNDDIGGFVARQFQAYGEMDIFMQPQFAGQPGQPDLAYDAPKLSFITQVRVFHGLIGLAVMVLLMFCVPSFIEERRYGLEATLKACGKLGAYNASLWGTALVVAVAVGVAGLCAIFAFAPHLMAPAHVGAAALLSYAAVCALLMVLAARYLRSAAIIQSFGLLLVLLNIFFGGVLLDLAEVSPLLAWLQWLFPLWWYVGAVLI
ncbi:MAG: hypothetical protein FWD96_06120, partial [Defluviitaleaceae bacterium]|nr:hypothetical protein [Defluviitaleaceae bacterium]